jgi:hypothetical protein
LLTVVNVLLTVVNILLAVVNILTLRGLWCWYVPYRLCIFQLSHLQKICTTEAVRDMTTCSFVARYLQVQGRKLGAASSTETSVLPKRKRI